MRTDDAGSQPDATVSPLGWRTDGPFVGGGFGVLRVALAVVVGYLVMAMLVMSTMFLSMQMMDLDSIFEPGLWKASDRWNAIVVMIGLLSAVAGGAVCERIARNRMGIRLLGLVFAVAIVGSSVTALRAGPDGPAEPRPTIEAMEKAAAAKDQSLMLYAMTEAGRHAREPRWLKVANPVCGLVGALLGAVLARRQRPLP